MPLPLERDRGLGPEPPEQRDLLLDPLPAVLEIRPEPVELHPVPADADAKAETALRQDVERRGLLRHERRLPLREDEHAGRELELRRDRGGVREEHHDLVERRLDAVRPGPARTARLRAEHVVIGDEAVEAHRLDLADQARDGRRIAPDLGLREDGVEPHRT